MYTPTLGEIQTAITTKNRKQAAEMIQTLIQQKPSADAWYLAAQMTTDRDTKIHYLRTALLLDRHHQKSQDALRQLGERAGNYYSNFAYNLLHILKEHINRSPLLRPFPPAIQLTFVAVLGIFLVVMVGVLISGLLASRGPVLSADGPSTPAVEFFSTSQIQNVFTTGELDIMFTELKRDNAIGKDIIQLDVRDVGNRARTVEVFVYDNVQAIINDQNTLAIYEQATHILAYANIVVVYPLDMSDSSITHLVDIMDTIQS